MHMFVMIGLTKSALNTVFKYTIFQTYISERLMKYLQVLAQLHHYRVSITSTHMWSYRMSAHFFHIQCERMFRIAVILLVCVYEYNLLGHKYKHDFNLKYF